MGAAAMVSSFSPLRLSVTAFSEISNSPVTFAPGALARNQALKSLRSAERLARYDFTAALSKSIFLPGGGLVFAEVERGSPFNWTMALLLSCPGRESFASEGAAANEGTEKSRARAAIGRKVFTCTPVRGGRCSGS